MPSHWQCCGDFPGKSFVPARLTDREGAPLGLTWAQRLARVFKIDVTVCERCGGAVITRRGPRTSHRRCDLGALSELLLEATKGLILESAPAEVFIAYLNSFNVPVARSTPSISINIFRIWWPAADNVRSRELLTIHE
jgi:hypothetical protein